MNKLSVVISAYNNEEKIKDCLDSVKFADEIIFVDNTSIDKTAEIARRYTSNVFKKPNNLMLNVNKNFGFSKAAGDWILSLDADERVTEELEKEIKEILSHNSSARSAQSDTNGYWIPRKNIIFGKWIRHAGWYPDHQLRLFRKNKGKFEEKHVHEMVKVEGKTDYLKGHIIHLNYETIQQFIHKTSNIYVPNEADVLFKNGYRVKFEDAIMFPSREFLSRFFARKGYKDGFHGLVLSMLMAFYHFIIFVSVWEKQKFLEVGENNLLDQVQDQFKKAYKESMYWFLKEKIENSKNPLKKFFHRLSGKIRV